jgi:uncharacterized protein (TIGR03437 family)
MKVFAALFFALLTSIAPAALGIITLGTSNQDFGLTGIGDNGQGEGQSLMSWGTCTYDGKTTTCTLSGPYTGLGSGGTYNFVVSYPGNGTFPLNAISTTPGGDFFYVQATANYTFGIRLVPTYGPPISFYSFANFQFLYTGATSCTGVSQANCSVGHVGLTANATITGRITGSFDPTPMISASGVVSAGNYGGFPSIAPATWIEMYGINLATTLSQIWGGADFQGDQAPSSLAGTTVTVAGIPAFVDFVSPGQVNVEVPSGVPSGMQQIVVTTAGGTSTAYNIQVDPLKPGLLAPPAFKINGKQNVVALFSNTLKYVLPNSVSGVQTARARAGDNLTLYGIGFGPVTPNILAGKIVRDQNQLKNDFHIKFGGVEAKVTYAGLTPGFVGLYQINVVVPSVSASDQVPVTFSLAGTPGTQELYIAIQ